MRDIRPDKNSNLARNLGCWSMISFVLVDEDPEISQIVPRIFEPDLRLLVRF